MGLLESKIAVITGGGRGIGKATAQLFTNEGATVVIAEFDEVSGQSTANELGAHFIKTDISNEESVNALFNFVSSKFGQLDILVNNAGILADSTLKKLDSDSFDAVINVNLRGVYLCGRAAANIMIEQGSGVILNASSVVAHHGNFGQTNYVASKAGVIGITKVWARELGKDGIRVNAVAPGFIETNMTEGMPEKVVNMMGEKVPLKRWGQPEDVANAYTFLASDEASYITGAVLNVDGGVVV
ncbi:MAG: SDR family oxidoreductase [Candidatus Marinimicrobia bacterium]|jgi:3-oxoacyl-[acyl-carrier protein] reductase|nr:SDR family oxidoreductase [Candidatus Neomarinimicrobiota bacterium]MBT3945147.1 SDR family oxidoreductase [Candidatus Neomarinimicrobiota bacterium]MBT4054195.1 SDR family oxidoreductase [Candidatus Neomarinimicrobiota bacterium]MBT4828874.1 SDR family oxidoreductase [Candidatus Neomarinimicrobiota bacterium]MBT5225709.1 SDR family oxidoreductase [Candidatus Neomarinimicrobiota bacterium]